MVRFMQRGAIEAVTPAHRRGRPLPESPGREAIMRLEGCAPGSTLLRIVSLALVATLAACRSEDTPPQVQEPGRERTPKTRALETGANILQDVTPVEQIGIYLVGFHPMKDDPSVQMESHHYCDQVNQDFAQCVLYDGNTENANLHGIEYIISERLYTALPAEEKPYWHPHNYEILSGQLVMPGLPEAAEKEALRGKVNSYGKTWHVWRTGVHRKAGDRLPLGAPHLAWSFNDDGEAAPGLVEERDRRMGIDSAEKRRDRADLAALARPQGGADALQGKFPTAGRSLTP